jgi:hypothetical protein
MRTTLDIENDVLAAVKNMARREGRSTGKVISRLVRQALCGGKSNGRPRIEDRNGVPVLSTGDEIITMEHIRSIMEEEDISAGSF